jgi:hypothetical protein
MKILKVNSKGFCEFIKFPKICKDLSSLQRLDKISIFEYFNVIEERTKLKSQQILLKEIADFLLSHNFNNEFKFTFLNEEKKFKFFLLNIGLISNRVQNSLKEENLNFKNYLKNLLTFNKNNKEYESYITRLKIIFCLKFLPLKYYCKEILQFYLGNNQIKKKYESNLIVQDEYAKKYTKIDFSFLSLKRQFIKDLDTIEDNEEKFKDKYIKNFLLKDEDTNKLKRENDYDKLVLYFIAHVIIILIH